jgi:hypothetical protein
VVYVLTPGVVLGLSTIEQPRRIEKGMGNDEPIPLRIYL